MEHLGIHKGKNSYHTLHLKTIKVLDEKDKANNIWSALI